MSNKDGEWHPYEITGDFHRCPRRGRRMHLKAEQNIEPRELDNI
jgi:hypothetical protein